MAAESKIKPLARGCRFVVSEITEDEVTEEKSYVLTPIGEYPLRAPVVGDIFEPVDYDPEKAR